MAVARMFPFSCSDLVSEEEAQDVLQTVVDTPYKNSAPDKPKPAPLQGLAENTEALSDALHEILTESESSRAIVDLVWAHDGTMTVDTKDSAPLYGAICRARDRLHARVVLFAPGGAACQPAQTWQRLFGATLAHATEDNACLTPDIVWRGDMMLTAVDGQRVEVPSVSLVAHTPPAVRRARLLPERALPARWIRVLRACHTDVFPPHMFSGRVLRVLGEGSEANGVSQQLLAAMDEAAARCGRAVGLLAVLPSVEQSTPWASWEDAILNPDAPQPADRDIDTTLFFIYGTGSNVVASELAPANRVVPVAPLAQRLPSVLSACVRSGAVANAAALLSAVPLVHSWTQLECVRHLSSASLYATWCATRGAERSTLPALSGTRSRGGASSSRSRAMRPETSTDMDLQVELPSTTQTSTADLVSAAAQHWIDAQQNAAMVVADEMDVLARGAARAAGCRTEDAGAGKMHGPSANEPSQRPIKSRADELLAAADARERPRRKRRHRENTEETAGPVQRTGEPLHGRELASMWARSGGAQALLSALASVERTAQTRQSPAPISTPRRTPKRFRKQKKAGAGTVSARDLDGSDDIATAPIFDLAALSDARAFAGRGVDAALVFKRDWASVSKCWLTAGADAAGDAVLPGVLPCTAAVRDRLSMLQRVGEDTDRRLRRLSDVPSRLRGSESRAAPSRRKHPGATSAAAAPQSVLERNRSAIKRAVVQELEASIPRRHPQFKQLYQKLYSVSVVFLKDAAPGGMRSEALDKRAIQSCVARNARNVILQVLSLNALLEAQTQRGIEGQDQRQAHHSVPEQRASLPAPPPLPTHLLTPSSFTSVGDDIDSVRGSAHDNSFRGLHGASGSLARGEFTSASGARTPSSSAAGAVAAALHTPTHAATRARTPHTEDILCDETFESTAKADTFT